MTSDEALKTKLPKGCIFKNVAKNGCKPNWVIKKGEGSFALNNPTLQTGYEIFGGASYDKI